MRFNYPFSLCVILFVVPFILNHLPHANATYKGLGGEGPVPVSDGPTVRKSERWPLVSSEFGEISAVKINDGNNGCYHLHFITMNPRSLFLPVYLHSQMLIYVKSGVGILSWINIENDDKLQQITLQKGDIYRLSPETVFYIQNNIHSYEYQPKQLQIHAIFPDSETKLQDETQFEGVYTGIQDLVLGFDNPVLQSALSVPEGVIEELRRGERQPLIVEGQSEGQSSIWDDVGSWDWGIRAFLGTKNDDIFSVRNKKKAYNIYKEGPDVKTQNGWSVAVTKKQLDVLKGTDFGVFMVNLTAGSMMGPHWNPKSVEIAIVLHGQGMIQVVCASMKSETGCKNMRFRVEEGDVFVVPRYHPMAQISFNNDSFVFMGFMLTLKHISPRYLSGKWSILKRLDRNVLQKSFNVKNSTIDWVLTAQREKLIYECISCAEDVAGESTEGGGGGGGGGGQQEEEGGGGQQKEEGRGGRGWRQKEEEGGGRGGWQEEEKGGGRGGRQEEEEGGGGGWRLEEEEGGGGGVMEGDMGGEAAAKGNGVAGKGGGIHV